jgi:hypothetical protein
MSDGQIVNSEHIRIVRLFPDSLTVELVHDEPIRIQGSGVHADANVLEEIRDKEKLHYLVQRPGNLFYAVSKDGKPNIWSLPPARIAGMLEEKGFTLHGQGNTKQEAYDILLKIFGEPSVRYL